jgi:hypothetical protein
MVFAKLLRGYQVRKVTLLGMFDVQMSREIGETAATTLSNLSALGVDLVSACCASISYCASIMSQLPSRMRLLAQTYILAIKAAAGAQHSQPVERSTYMT